MNEKDVREMLENALHFGHKSQKWNPKMSKYIFDKREGIHVFDLNKTAQALENAISIVKDAANAGKTILFVGTKPHVSNVVAEQATRAGMPYITGRWIPGVLTNFSTLKKRIKHLLDLKEKADNGELSKYTKKEAGKKRKEMVSLEVALGGILNLKKVPDVIFVLSAKRDIIAIKESKRLKIPVIAVCDSDADPTQVDTVIPANDDSIKSVNYILSKVADAINSSKQKK